MQKEEWRPVIGYEGQYEVSDLGRIRSLTRTVERIDPRNKTKTRMFTYKGRLRPFWITKKGYCRIALCKNGKNRKHLVHRLVAEAFLDKVDGKTQVNHINGVKSDNRPENLEWCNNRENWLHSVRIGKQNTSHKTGGTRDMSKYL